MQFCPHCGFDLASSGPIEFGNIAITDRAEIIFEGRRVHLSRCQYDIVESLVRAQGRHLTRGLLAQRVGGDVNDATVTKYVERVRRSFCEIKPDFDQLISMRGFGTYCWQEKCRA